MTKKKRVTKKRGKTKNSETLGIAGFTLGIVSLVILIPNPVLGIMISTTGFILCFLQQKKYKTKMGKNGLIINGISFVTNIAWWVVYAMIIYPYIQQNLNYLSSTIPPA